MQRRLELACSLIHDPSILVVDEPTAGLDPVLRQKIWEEVRALREQGTTIVVATQHIDEASYCNAAQLAMLVLIAAVFFSSFMIYLDAIEWPVRAVSHLLPTTYAIRSLRDVMLRGFLLTPLDLIVLGAMSAGLFILTVILFRREFRSR